MNKPIILLSRRMSDTQGGEHLFSTAGKTAKEVCYEKKGDFRFWDDGAARIGVGSGGVPCRHRRRVQGRRRLLLLQVKR
jgi:hypothetical protein